MYELKDASVSHPLYQSLTYQVDSTQQSVDEISKEKFTKTPPIQGQYHPDAYFWIKAQIKNETDYQHFVLTIDQWSEATVYVRESGRWRSMASGTSVPVTKRPLSLHRLLSFPLTLAHTDTTTIYMRVRYTRPVLNYFVNLYSFFSKVELDESASAYRKYIGVQLLVMFIIGVLTILLFYNLILFVFNKEVTSLVLSCYLLINALAIANSNGIATNYFFKNTTGFELPLGILLGHAIPVIMALFLILFLKLTRRDWESFVLGGFVAVVLVSMVVSLYKHVQALYIIRRYLVYLSFLLVLAFSIYKKRPGAKTLMVALIFTITTSYFAEFRSVFFRNSSFTSPDRPYLMGVLIQMLILSGAATYRIRQLRRDVEVMKEEQRTLIERQNTQLKTQVDEKTQQLRQALTSLEQKKDQLEAANTVLSEKSISIQDLNQKLEALVVTRTQALQSTMRDLDTFLYRTSHDLRRPLMTILGLTNLVQAENDAKRIHETIGHINKTVNDLDRMLHKLIAIGFCYGEKLQTEPVDLADVTRESVESIRRDYLLPEGRIEMFTQSRHEAFPASAYLLRMMITCILENAVQYGGGERIKVLIESRPGLALLTVEDTGPGIDVAYQPLVFDMFFRAHEKSTGNGLGLYLVRIGAEKLGGKVTLHSATGRGTTLQLLFQWTDASAIETPEKV